MKRKEALDSIIKSITNYDAVISSTGLITRELFEYYDSEQIFYMPGSMGLVSSIGLGIALNISTKRIIIIDGDGSLLMNLGAMATIGHKSPNNLIHIVLDNEAYASCSEEPSISNTVKLEKLAEIFGYKKIIKIDNEKELEHSIKECLKSNILTFILAKIKLGGRRDLDRPINLEQIKERFQNFLLH